MVEMERALAGGLGDVARERREAARHRTQRRTGRALFLCVCWLARFWLVGWLVSSVQLQQRFVSA